MFTCLQILYVVTIIYSISMLTSVINKLVISKLMHNVVLDYFTMMVEMALVVIGVLYSIVLKDTWLDSIVSDNC